MICILDDNNQIINIINTDLVSAENERPYYDWCELWEQYTDKKPFNYLKSELQPQLGKEFAKRRDAIRWIDFGMATYGFDAATDDITNFMAAYTPMLFDQSITCQYKVWLDAENKGIKEFGFAEMQKVYETVRTSQLDAYAWYEKAKAALEAVEESEGNDALQAVFDKWIAEE